MSFTTNAVYIITHYEATHLQLFLLIRHVNETGAAR